MKRHPTDMSAADITDMVREACGLMPYDLGLLPAAAYTTGGRAYWRAAAVRTWWIVACNTQNIPELRAHRDPVLADWLRRKSAWMQQLCTDSRRA